MEASDTLHKFLFLGVLMLLVIFGSSGNFHNAGANVYETNSKIARPSSSIPVFVLNPPATGGIGGDRVLSGAEENRPSVVSLQNDVQNNQPVATDTKPLSSEESTTANQSLLRIGSEPAPQIQAVSALVARLTTDEKFFEMEPAKRWPIASITKLVTAAVILRDPNFSKVIDLIPEDFPFGDKESPTFKAGGKYTAGDLFAAMLLRSSNESAEALARSYGNSLANESDKNRQNFIAEMNKLVLRWGVQDTHFDDPTGLSVANQSTVHDLFLIAKRIYSEYGVIFDKTRQKTANIGEVGSGNKSAMKNINLFAGQPQFLGGKTGYTDEASGNLLSIFSYNKKPVFIVVLGTPDRFGDTEKLFNWLKRNYR